MELESVLKIGGYVILASFGANLCIYILSLAFAKIGQWLDNVNH